MNNVAIICVLKSGGDFCVCDVDVLYDMLKQHTTVPFDFYCLTDLDTKGKYKTIPLLNNFHGWWSKIELFRSNLVPNKRIFYLDLDTVIIANIDEFLVREEPFIGLRPFGNDSYIGVDNYFASGVLSWVNDGSFTFLYDLFNYAIHRKQFRGDQDYLSYAMQYANSTPFQAVLWQNITKGIYSYKKHILTKLVPRHHAKIVCFHGKPRPKHVNYEV